MVYEGLVPEPCRGDSYRCGNFVACGFYRVCLRWVAIRLDRDRSDPTDTIARNFFLDLCGCRGVGRGTLPRLYFTNSESLGPGLARNRHHIAFLRSRPSPESEREYYLYTRHRDR